MGYSNPIIRNREALELLNYGFSNYELKKIVTKGESFGFISSILYENKKINIVAKEDIYILLKKGDTNYQIDYSYQLTKNNYLDEIGKIEIKYDNELYCTEGLILETTKKKSFIKLFFDCISDILC